MSQLQPNGYATREMDLSQIVLRDRHRDYYLAVAEASAAAIDAGDPVPDGVAAIGREIDNIRAALAWCESRRHAALASFAIALEPWWLETSSYLEGLRWCDRALGLDISIRTRGRLLTTASRLHLDHGEPDVAFDLASTAIAAATDAAADDLLAEATSALAWAHYALGDHVHAATEFERALGTQALPTRRRATTLWGLAFSHAGLNDIDRAAAVMEEAAAFVRGLAKDALLADHMLRHANVLAMSSRYTEASAIYEEESVLRRRMGDERGYAQNREQAGEAANYRVDSPGARAAFEQAVEAQAAASLPVRVQALAGLAAAVLGAGEVDRAELLVADALAALRSAEGDAGWWHRTLQHHVLGLMVEVALEQGDLDRAAATNHERLAAAATVGAAAESESWRGAARIALDRGQTDIAGEHFRAAIAALGDDPSSARIDIEAEATAELEDPGTAAALLERSATVGDEAPLDRVQRLLGVARYHLAAGNPSGATDAARACEVTLATVPRLRRFALPVLAQVAAATGDPAAAQLFEDVVASGQRPRARVAATEMLAEVAARQGSLDRAELLLSEADADRARLAFPRRVEARALEARVRALLDE